MDDRNELLLLSAARLYSLGIDVEAAREKLRQLVAAGVPYGAAEMREALAEFQRLDKLWKDLEAQHLALRDDGQR